MQDHFENSDPPFSVLLVTGKDAQIPWK